MKCQEWAQAWEKASVTDGRWELVLAPSITGLEAAAAAAAVVATMWTTSRVQVRACVRVRACECERVPRMLVLDIHPPPPVSGAMSVHLVVHEVLLQ